MPRSFDPRIESTINSKSEFPTAARRGSAHRLRFTTAYQIWVSDHGQHDVWVRNDLFSGVSTNAAVRPWLTAVLDMRSRKVLGTAWSANPCSHTISSALRLGIADFGIPQVLYVDNGKDFEKIGRVDFSPECSGVLIRLGIQPRYCLPGHPESKLIESWFGTVRKRFDCLWPSYCGRGPKDRPEQCTNALTRNPFHGRLRDL
jgi:putative transposase